MKLLGDLKHTVLDKRNRPFLLIFVVCTAVFFIMSLKTVFRDDDIWFAAKTVEFSLFDWIIYCSSSWSS